MEPRSIYTAPAAQAASAAPVKKHLQWLDMAKGLAILTVVLGHCMSDTTGLHDLVYSFHMPLFFMLAGYTMRPKPRKTVLASSFKRLIVPYMAVCCILLLFAIVPPNSIDPNLDSQRSLPVVAVEALYASGQEGALAGHTFQAIGAIWFLPCLFWGRLILNEVLLRTQRLAGVKRLAQPAAVLAITALGFVIGNEQRLPLDIDTALTAVFFMYAGYLAKCFDISKAPDWVWLALVGIWMLYSIAGSNEMAVRAYLEHPYSMLTATAGSLVMIKLSMEVEKLGHAVGSSKVAPRVSKSIALASRAFAWMGVQSLIILCVHRIESAVFNWQKIMETFVPSVWDWPVAYQGLYMFALRFALVLVISVVLVACVKALRGAWDGGNLASSKLKRRLQSAAVSQKPRRLANGR